MTPASAAPQNRGLSVDIDRGGIEGLVNAGTATPAAGGGDGPTSTTAAAAGAAAAGTTPGVLSLTIPSTPLARPSSASSNPTTSATPLVVPKRKPNLPNKSKMMALVGEMLPQNALDPTGYENHEAEAKARAEEMANQIDALEEGHVELDEFGNRRYKSLKARVRFTLRRQWRGCWKVYDPASPNRQYWSLLVVIFLLYGMVEIPLRVGFEQDVVPWSAADLFNLFIDIFFLVDIFMNFRTGYFQEDNRLILDGTKIARRYMRSWFLLDLITSIPLSHILQGAFTATSGLAALTLPRLLRVFRIVRLFKILRMLKLMNNVSNWSESANQKLFSLFIKVLKFVTLIFLLSHLSGCIWGYIALQQVDSSGNFHPLSWPYRYGIYNKDVDTSFSRLYLLSLYWALCTLTTVGYGDIHAGTAGEYAFCIVLTFIGTCCFGLERAAYQTRHVARRWMRAVRSCARVVRWIAAHCLLSLCLRPPFLTRLVSLQLHHRHDQLYLEARQGDGGSLFASHDGTQSLHGPSHASLPFCPAALRLRHASNAILSDRI